MAAALPLLLDHGSAVTTRQIAAAAGIAEGTIFRVFADKDALIDAVVQAVFDPEQAVDSLRSIDRTRPLEERLIAAAEVFQRRVTVIWQVMTAVGMTTPPEDRREAARRADAPEVLELTTLFEPDRDGLRYAPLDAAQRLRALVFACSHPALVADQPMPAAEIVHLLLDGIRRPTDQSPET